MLKSIGMTDALLLAMESPETPMHIGGLQILRKPPGAGRDFVRKLRERLMKVPVSGAPFNYRYRSKGPLPGVPAWEVLPDVDLGEHLFHHALPWPGTEKELFELVSRLNSGSLDRSRPLWEQHLIEGLAGNRYATFTRVHHALIDGQWAMKLHARTTSPDRDARNLPPYWAVDAHDTDATRSCKNAKKSDRKPAGGWLERGRAGLNEGVEVISELGTALGHLVESYLHPTDGGLVPIYQAPLCILNGKVSARREMGVTRLEMARIHRLARAHGAKVNDIVLTVCGGGLRRYLLERDALPMQALVAGMIVAVERASGQEAGNSIATAQVTLATHLEDPVERFEAVRSSSQHAKEQIHGLVSPMALNLYVGLTGVPFLLYSLAGRPDRARAQNVVISNVVGMREKRYVNGAFIESEYPMSVLVPGQAVNITVISRANLLDVAVLACPTLVPNPGRIGEAIAESLDELEGALRRPRRTATRKKATRQPRK